MNKTLTCAARDLSRLEIAPAFPPFLTYTDVGNAGVAWSYHRPPSMAEMVEMQEQFPAGRGQGEGADQNSQIGIAELRCATLANH